MKIVAATCLEQYSRSTVLFEPLNSGLSAGRLASPALVWVERRTAYVPIVNVGATDVLLYPHTVVGILAEVSIVSLPAGVTWVPSCVSTVATQSVFGSVLDQIDVLDLSSLPDVEQAKVRSLLKKYTIVFSAHDGDLGCTDLMAHKIPLLDNVPIWQCYRRILSSDYEVVKEHINNLLRSQVIRESSRPYASPIVLIKKKYGSLCMCVYYWQLNSKTRKDAFPLQCIKDSLHALTGARWFSTMDLASGYKQVQVDKVNQPKQHFASLNGTACLLVSATPSIY